VTIVAT